MKRSSKVALVMAGTGALAAYMITREPHCRTDDPNRTEPCRSSNWRSSSGSSSSGRGYYWWGTGGSSSSKSATSPQGVVSRGGFGATGSALSSGHGGS
jgi:uncharacterized protein YgiB involved in biofilm formation